MLATDHAELDGLLDELFAAFEAGVVRHIYQRLDLFWARLAMHIRAEHLHLFPAVLEACLTGKQISRRATAPEVARDKISALQKDHNFFMRELVSAIKQTRELLRETNGRKFQSPLRMCAKRSSPSRFVWRHTTSWKKPKFTSGPMTCSPPPSAEI